MTKQVTEYRVLISLPSDLIEIQKEITEVIYAWNAANQQLDIRLEPVFWKTHTTPQMGDRPQEIINKQIVRECDVLIGAFWTRLGTNTGKFVSGTVEEIEEFINSGKEVLLYFSQVPIDPTKIDYQQYKKLKEFKEKCEKSGLIDNYSSTDELKQKINMAITNTIHRLHDSTTKSQLLKIRVEDKYLPNWDYGVFKLEFQSFLKRLENEWIAEQNSDPININEGKFILEMAYSEVLEFQSKLSKDFSKIEDLLKEAGKRLKKIRNHQLYLDGGASFREFWEEGGKIIEILKMVPQEMK